MPVQAGYVPVEARPEADARADGGSSEEAVGWGPANLRVGSSRVDLQACKLEYSIVSPK